MTDNHKVGMVGVILAAVVLIAFTIGGHSCSRSSDQRHSKENTINIKLTDEAIKALNGQPLELRLLPGGDK